MPTPPLSEQTLREAIDAVARFGSIRAAAVGLGVPRPTFQHRYRKALAAGFDEAIVHPAPVGHTVKGVSTLYDQAGNVIQQWVKTRTDQMPLEEVIEAIQAAFDDYVSPAQPTEPPANSDDDLATVYPIADSHFGLYAWAAETGEDFDLKTAQEVNSGAFYRLSRSTPSSAHAVILGLGDLLHADDTTNRTAKSGHSLDVDTRHAKVLKVATVFMIDAVTEALKKHQHVTVRNLPGNHDTHSAQAVTMGLWAWFRNEPRVTVDTDPGYFWWWRWGRVLLGATHGDMAKMPNLPMVMAASRPEDWGQTQFRHAFTGHIHTRTALESGGVIVESFQSTAARDAWHQASGYRAGRSLSAITFHKMLGEVARQKVNIF